MRTAHCALAARSSRSLSCWSVHNNWLANHWGSNGRQQQWQSPFNLMFARTDVVPACLWVRVNQAFWIYFINPRIFLLISKQVLDGRKEIKACSLIYWLGVRPIKNFDDGIENCGKCWVSKAKNCPLVFKQWYSFNIFPSIFVIYCKLSSIIVRMRENESLISSEMPLKG